MNYRFVVGNKKHVGSEKELLALLESDTYLKAEHGWKHSARKVCNFIVDGILIASVYECFTYNSLDRNWAKIQLQGLAWDDGWGPDNSISSFKDFTLFYVEINTFVHSSPWDGDPFDPQTVNDKSRRKSSKMFLTREAAAEGQKTIGRGENYRSWVEEWPPR